MSLNADTTKSTSSRDGKTSARGRGGGYRPKKMLNEQIQSLNLSPNLTDQSEEEEEKQAMAKKMAEEVQKPNCKDNDGLAMVLSADNNQKENKFQSQEVDTSNDSESVTEESDSDDSSNLELDITKKRCDFCGDPNHQNRFCPILDQVDNPKQDRKESISSPKKTVSCYYCHEEGHIRADCPKWQQKGRCYYCKKEGHLKADCPEKARQEVKKQRERIKLNYTFRKTANSLKESESTTSAVAAFYEGPSKEDEEEASKDDGQNPPPRVVIPYPVPASQIKSQVHLRSKLSSDSDPSLCHKILRSESSEEEELETFEENSEEDINKKENHTADDQEADKANEEKEEIEKAGQNGDGEVQENKDTTQNDNMEEGELQTETVEIDGCVEFDSDEEHSYYDCSDGEEITAGDGGGRKLKRVLEEDEYHGEDGALLCEDEPGSDATDEQEKKEEGRETGANMEEKNEEKMDTNDE